MAIQLSEHIRGTSMSQIFLLSIDHIDLADQTFCFRILMNVADLAEDINKNGQDFPVIVRRKPFQRKYQLVCGFRRILAMCSLGRQYVKAIDREMNDHEALRLAWSENIQRRSYSDLDKAHAIVKAHQSGRTMKELEELFELERRQLCRLKTLCELEPCLASAVKNREITTTHAIVLNEMKRKYPDLETPKWIEEIAKDELSIRQLRYRITQQHRQRPALQMVYSQSGTKLSLRRRVLDLSRLTQNEKKELLDLMNIIKESIGGESS